MNHFLARPVIAQSTVLVLHRASLAATLAAAVVAAGARAQDAGAAPAAGTATAPTAPAAEPMRSIFIDVSGKVQWRANADDAWHDAKVNDEVQPGVEVRTGLRSRATLRVGRNATVLVDAGTLFQLPTVAQEGEVLRTTAAVKHGRADFKVDKVGLSNDFKVVTPSTTLAVRGTEFAIATGALKQVEVVGARRNSIAAIELKYALTNSTVQMSGASSSSSGMHQPAHSAAEGASAPAATGSGSPATTQAERVQEAALGASPVRPGSAAEATTGNRASARNEKASGRTSGVVGRTRDRAQQASDRVDQAIAYLLQAENSLDGVEASRDALASLRQLAVARRDEARDALAAHQAAYLSSQELGSAANAAVNSFDERSAALHADFTTFDARLADATDALEAIRLIVGEGGGQGEGGGPVRGEGPTALVSHFGSVEGGGEDLSELIEAARDALLAMGDAHDSATEGLGLMAGDRNSLVSLVAEFRNSVRGEARVAADAYQLAVTRLAALVQTGAQESAVASAARATVLRLQGLIAAIALREPNSQTLAAARTALARLEAASTALSRASGYLSAIQAARTSAVNDSRAALLGQVEALYRQLLAARLRIVAEWVEASAGVDQRGSQLAAALAEAEDLYGGAAARFVAQGFEGDLEASFHADLAESIAADASAAGADEAQALADAELLEGVANDGRAAVVAADALLATELGAFNDAASGSQSLLAALEAASIADRRLQADGALEALDAMDAALVGILARAADLDGAIAGAVDLEAFDDIAGRAAAAVEAILQSELDVAGATAGASGGSDSAADAASRAARLFAVAQELQERFGFSPEITSAAVRATAALAASAGSAADRAAAAQRIVAGLAAIAQSDRVGTVLSRIEAVLAANDRTGSAAAALIARAEASYVSINESGASTFRLLTVDSRDAADAQRLGAQAQLDGLASMSVLSGQVVAALDGAELAADNAERSLASALLMRTSAETNEGSAANGLFRTQLALEAGNVTGASAESALTTGFAVAARSDATAAAGHADEAKGHSDLAVAFAADVNRLTPDVTAFGADRPAFEAAAAARQSAVDAAKANGDELAADAAFYDSIVVALADRAGTGAAAGSAAASGAASSQAAAIARQLATMASQAAVLAESASTNAGRLFGRSVAQYVGRAQAAAAGAEVHAIAANAAATRAEGSASTAAALVGSAQGGTN